MSNLPCHLNVKIFITIAVIFLTSCQPLFSPSVPRQLAKNPDDAAWAGAACAFGEQGPPDFKIHKRKQIKNQFIVLYTSTCLDGGPKAQGPERIVGYTIVQLYATGWDAIAGGYYVDTQPEHLPILVHDDIGLGEKGELLIVYGEVVQQKDVTTVEVTLSNGQVLREHVTNSFFLFTTPGTLKACERRALAYDGTVLERKNLGPMTPECQ